MLVDFNKIKTAALASLKHPGQGTTLPKQESSRWPVIYVFRHTQTYDNFRRIFSGRRNSRLTPTGIQQAKKLAKKLKDKRIDLMIVSPLLRCQQTAREVLRYHPKVKVEKEPLLLERDYGRLTGKSKLKLMREAPEKAILYRRSWDVSPPGGESIKNVFEQRIYPFCRNLVNRIRKEKINVSICCTNNTMRLIRKFFENLTIEETLTLENPFGDYASYVVKDKR